VQKQANNTEHWGQGGANSWKYRISKNWELRDRQMISFFETTFEPYIIISLAASLTGSHK